MIEVPLIGHQVIAIVTGVILAYMHMTNFEVGHIVERIVSWLAVVVSIGLGITGVIGMEFGLPGFSIYVAEILAGVMIIWTHRHDVEIAHNILKYGSWIIALVSIGLGVIGLM